MINSTNVVHKIRIYMYYPLDSSEINGIYNYVISFWKGSFELAYI